MALIIFTEIDSADTAQVSIRDYKFQPAGATTKKGDAVTWTSRDDASHDVEFQDFGSPGMSKGETYPKTFDTAGPYDDSWSIHRGMKGTVKVE